MSSWFLFFGNKEEVIILIAVNNHNKNLGI